MDSYINFGLLCTTSFFTLMNPLGVMPVFMTMTKELGNQERYRAQQRHFLRCPPPARHSLNRVQNTPPG